MNSIETILTDCFIALMLFILWAWDLPERSLLNRLAVKSKWPIQRLGLVHGWRLFSPDPATDNYRLQFKLRLADGSVVAIEPEYFRFPEVQRQPVRYRWTKMKNTLLRAESAPLRASVCKYVAAEFQAQSANKAQQPVEVQLVRWRQCIAPFGAKEIESCEPYKRRIIYTQPINPTAPAAIAGHDVEPVQMNFCRE
jgi:hypothetical protein